MIFASVYMLKSGYLKLRLSDIPKAWVTTSCLMVLAIIANVALNQDYMLLNTGNGSPLAFLLDHGQLVYTLSMIGLGYIVIAIIMLVALGVVSLLNREH